MIFVFPETYLYRQESDSTFTFELGGYYYNPLQGQVLQFIKTSPKGFNFLNVKNGRCHFKSHLFHRGGGDVKRKRHITLSCHTRYGQYRIELFKYLEPLSKHMELVDALRELQKR